MPPHSPILYFDGVCNLCSSTVQLVLRHNNKKNIMFSSLQSNAGQEMLKSFDLPTETLSSLILVENGKYYAESTGALKLARHLDGLWSFLYAFIIIPPFIRDFIYKWVAKNRYKWFGKKNECWLPTPEFKSRFID